jgi:hypothetical protein
LWDRPHHRWRHGKSHDRRDDRSRHRVVHAKPVRDLVAVEVWREWPSIGRSGGSPCEPTENEHRDRAISDVMEPLEGPSAIRPALIVTGVHLAEDLLGV